MSEENLEVVRRLFELSRNRDTQAEGGIGPRDLAVGAELYHPDIEVDATRAPMPDLHGRYRGYVEVMRFWSGWLGAWDSFEVDEELFDAGEKVLARIHRQTMRGKGSGAEVEFGAYWQVFELREGRVIRQTVFWDESEARQAAGLTD
jgi:ketosteroid isomerase-like protein